MLLNDYNLAICIFKVLAHRLGLIPIAANPKLFEDFKQGNIHRYINYLKFFIQIIVVNN